MRLWSKQLLPYLPCKQLVSQWREIIMITTCLTKNNLNHGLVNKVKDYNYNHFYSYARLTVNEMTKRGYKVSNKTYENFINNLTSLSDIKEIPYNEVYSQWHNDIYLRQCLYNLEEKYNCGLIKQNEWNVIYNQFKDFTPLCK